MTDGFKITKKEKKLTKKFSMVVEKWKKILKNHSTNNSKIDSLRKSWYEEEKNFFGKCKVLHYGEIFFSQNKWTSTYMSFYFKYFFVSVSMR